MCLYSFLHIYFWIKLIIMWLYESYVYIRTVTTHRELWCLHLIGVGTRSRGQGGPAPSLLASRGQISYMCWTYALSRTFPFRHLCECSCAPAADVVWETTESCGYLTLAACGSSIAVLALWGWPLLNTLWATYTRSLLVMHVTSILLWTECCMVPSMIRSCGIPYHHWLVFSVWYPED